MRALPLLTIVGPTASGKSELALALAKAFGGEVISADSVQVYRYFDIGSGKLKESERDGISHHGIDLVEPVEDMDASRFGELASAWIHDIRARGQLPIVCGGTFLWIRALLHGLAPAPAKDDALREKHRRIAETLGRAALHQELARVDPRSAMRLGPNDFVRVSRALEVYELTRVPLSEIQREHGFSSERHRPVFVAIEHGDQLAERIVRRVAAMLDQGFEREVAELCVRGFRDTRPMLSVGYRQLLRARESHPSPPRDELVAEVARAMRIFSRRQRTWLRDRDVTWLTPEQAANRALPKAVLERLGL